MEFKNNSLSKLLSVLKNNLGLTPYIGVELEFYIHGKINILDIQKKLNISISEERGENQYEVSLPPSKNILEYIKYIENLRKDIIDEVCRLGAKADFSPKPFKNDYGSSMQINLSFFEDDDVEKYSKILCYYLQDSIDIYLPKYEDYQRLDRNYMSPTHICYGANNRTALIRIVEKKEGKYLEHRLPSANANPYNLICAILESIVKWSDLSIKEQKNIDSIRKIYGNAWDKQYKLQKIKDFL